MGTSIIDGTITEAEVKRSRGGMTVFKSVDFQLDGGSRHMIKNAVVKQEVADELKPGTRGRFYAYTAFDLKGIHGLRTPDGRAVYGFPGNNQKIFLITGIANILWIALMLFTRGGVPLLGVALLILSVVGYIFMGKGASEAKAQFEGDAGYRPNDA
ncbi:MULTISPECIES: hypothetical protein [unclassified Sphingopyxis]|uniref:hypothetical protein n=1 Tax=unclassified Sphingopyxis TaxID=2614943 RepID=UPI000736C539|nr:MULTISPECIES: hypothetical protein [unclassified Sphingopyxis]KTE38810.1 hypothetical protein ATE62_10505 [Sphingopyxis sp. HIX]KTE79697.1 hypothetical protein ATE72_18640 [Sphingopyxis sp. HXXIV]